MKVPMTCADVNKFLMSVHKMNQAGLKVVLDGDESCYQDKATGRKGKIKYHKGKYTFEIWAEKGDKNGDDVEVDAIKGNKWQKVLRGNKYQALVEEDEGSDFSWQD